MQTTVNRSEMDANEGAPDTRNKKGLFLAEPMGYIKVGPGLDLERYAYCAAPVMGQCLSTRPGGPVFDGDTIVFRELSGWSDSRNPGILLPYVGRLVGVVTRRGFMLKELEQVDFYNRCLKLKQYTPLRSRTFLFGEVTALYAVDEVQRGVEFV